MVKKVNLSEKHLSFKDIQNSYSLLVSSLKLYFDISNIEPHIGKSESEIQEEHSQELEELDKSMSLILLAAIEAHLRVDCLNRCYNKKKDQVSKNLRKFYLEHENKIKIREHILSSWRLKEEIKDITDKITAALNYRDWLAHGRYWVPKLGRDFDFPYLYTLAQEISEKFK